MSGPGTAGGGRIVPVGDDGRGGPSEAALARAIEVLAQGRPIGLPTDTVYGLAADPFVLGATDRIFAMKVRPRDVCLPVLVASLDQALDLATAVPDTAAALMARFWPGPLTVVLPARPGLTADLGDDEATIGVRCPDHPVPLALCAAVGPLATTSANRHGEPTLTTAAEVADAFGESLALVLDGGTCTGSPSTVVDCTGVEPKLLREGRLPWSVLVGALAG
ncbi:MAG: L-threonylcarbamoyladenylate synthase [Actinomycetota bacterium]|nr:L-threonylcarbamoyladenylate synthase [Actinomycetota bacterium]